MHGLNNSEDRGVITIFSTPCQLISEPLNLRFDNHNNHRPESQTWAVKNVELIHNRLNCTFRKYLYKDS